jgi:phage terminase large subunit-like protein
MIVSLDQRSTEMRNAYNQFYEAVQSRALAHDGDAVLTSHVLNAAAQPDDFGNWRVRKLKQSHKIDGLVSAVLAHSRAAREPAMVEPWILFA